MVYDEVEDQNLLQNIFWWISRWNGIRYIRRQCVENKCKWRLHFCVVHTYCPRRNNDHYYYLWYVKCQLNSINKQLRIVERQSCYCIHVKLIRWNARCSSTLWENYFSNCLTILFGICFKYVLVDNLHEGSASVMSFICQKYPDPDIIILRQIHHLKWCKMKYFTRTPMYGKSRVCMGVESVDIDNGRWWCIIW